MDSCTFNIFKGVDGQVFPGLTAGTYTIFIEATATNNTNEVAYDTVGPVLLAIGANASISEAIGKYIAIVFYKTSCFLLLPSCSCMFWKTRNTL